MKYYYYIFLFLTICIGFLCEIHAQKLQLSIEASNNVSESILDSISIQTSFKNYRTLQEEVDAIQVQLETMGFIESELQSLQKKNDSSFVATFHFGNRYHSIKIYYSQFDFSKKELINISSEIHEEYFVIPFNKIETSMRNLNKIKTWDGNTFSRLKLEGLEKQNDFTLKAQLILVSGSMRTIDHIIVKGYEKFPLSYLKYYAGVKTGMVFNKEKISEQSEVLNTLGFVSTIKQPEVLFEKDSTTVFFYLKKQNDNLFDGVLGFSTDEDTQKLIFNGYLNLELNNNLNYGEQFILNYKADGNDQQNFRVKITMPYMFKSPFGLGLELKIFKRDSTFSTTAQEARLSYQINSVTNSYLGYKGYESSNLQDEIITDTSVEDFNSKNIIIGFRYAKPQGNILFPLKLAVSLSSEIGSREFKSTKESQIRFSGLLYYIFNLNYKNSIFLQNTTRILKSDTYLTNELFRFGGINTIRGFDENSLDASFYSVLNSEYRYQFNEDLYAHSIIDVAYYDNQILSLKQNLYSFGFGFGLNTKAGIFKFNIANGLTENQDFNYSNTKIHLSISSRF